MLTVSELQRPGLKPLSFTLNAGECIAVSGPSGSGKSLLLRALADLDPNEGDIRFNDRPRDDFTAPEWRQKITYLAAEPGWWSDHIAEHFTDFKSTLPLIARLGLPKECGDWPVIQASTGERQRLALVRGLFLQPDILLLDEPTAALDPAMTKEVEAIIQERLSCGCAAIWVTHDEAQATRMGSRNFQMLAGQLIEGAA